MVHEVVPEDVATARGQLVAIDLLTKLDGVEATTLRVTTPEEVFPRIHRGTGTQEVSMRLVNIGRRLVSTRLRVSRNLRWPRVTVSRTCWTATSKRIVQKTVTPNSFCLDPVLRGRGWFQKRRQEIML